VADAPEPEPSHLLERSGRWFESGAADGTEPFVDARIRDGSLVVGVRYREAEFERRLLSAVGGPVVFESRSGGYRPL
jgi:hypothetical protein